MMRREKGFTLIELLLVVVVMGLMLAVIVPRGQRATTDTRMNLVRQVASEMVPAVNDWIDAETVKLNSGTTVNRTSMLWTLVNGDAGSNGEGAQNTTTGNWVGSGGNWGKWDFLTNALDISRDNTQLPSGPVEDKVAIGNGNEFRNPFNQTSVFAPAQVPGDSAEIIPGAIAFVKVNIQDGQSKYAFLWLGTDNQVAAGLDDLTTGPESVTGWYRGQAITAAGLREGVYFSTEQ